jgi:hypothetical protein
MHISNIHIFNGFLENIHNLKRKVPKLIWRKRQKFYALQAFPNLFMFICISQD